jgi:hypothetical protein
MPRYVKSRLGYPTTKDRADRLTKSRLRLPSKLPIDPFPLVHGTLPEKMVYAELSRRQIPFLFLNDVNFKIPEIDFDKSFQADFVIPSLRIIIEVQGAYWHSMDKTIESDSFKFAIYELGGYRVLAWWDYDIYARLPALFDAEPVLAAAGHYTDSARGKSAELPVTVRTKIDTSGGIRTLNHKRAVKLAYKKPAVRQRFKNRRVL